MKKISFFLVFVFLFFSVSMLLEIPMGKNASKNIDAENSFIQRMLSCGLLAHEPPINEDSITLVGFSDHSERLSITGAFKNGDFLRIAIVFTQDYSFGEILRIATPAIKLLAFPPVKGERNRLIERSIEEMLANLYQSKSKTGNYLLHQIYFGPHRGEFEKKKFMGLPLCEMILERKDEFRID